MLIIHQLHNKLYSGLHLGMTLLGVGSGLRGERRERSATEAASHINVLELRTVVLALRHFLPRLSGQHVLVRTDNTAALAYINRQGGVHSQSLLIIIINK